MPRSTEQSYKAIANYLKTRGLPATLNDIVEANIVSKPTVYRLLRPESFPEAALFGIKALNDTKPYFFGYDASLQLDMLSKVDSKAAEVVKEHKEVMTQAAKQITANAVVLAPDEKRLVERFREHKERNAHVNFMENFDTKVPDPGRGFYILGEVAPAINNDMDKFRTVLVSMFVSTFNESGE